MIRRSSAACAALAPSSSPAATESDVEPSDSVRSGRVVVRRVGVVRRLAEPVRVRRHLPPLLLVAVDVRRVVVLRRTRRRGVVRLRRRLRIFGGGGGGSGGGGSGGRPRRGGFPRRLGQTRGGAFLKRSHHRRRVRSSVRGVRVVVVRRRRPREFLRHPSRHSPREFLRRRRGVLRRDGLGPPRPILRGCGGFLRRFLRFLRFLLLARAFSRGFVLPRDGFGDGGGGFDGAEDAAEDGVLPRPGAGGGPRRGAHLRHRVVRVLRVRRHEVRERRADVRRRRRGAVRGRRRLGVRAADVDQRQPFSFASAVEPFKLLPRGEHLRPRHLEHAPRRPQHARLAALLAAEARSGGRGVRHERRDGEDVRALRLPPHVGSVVQDDAQRLPVRAPRRALHRLHLARPLIHRHDPVRDVLLGNQVPAGVQEAPHLARVRPLAHRAHVRRAPRMRRRRARVRPVRVRARAARSGSGGLRLLLIQPREPRVQLPPTGPHVHDHARVLVRGVDAREHQLAPAKVRRRRANHGAERVLVLRRQRSLGRRLQTTRIRGGGGPRAAAATRTAARTAARTAR